MDAFYDDEMTHPSVRLHPYIAIHEGQSGYVDFKREPSRIPDVLEDFKPYAGERAIQTFYEFLRWINGPDSHLETCDCAFRGPAPHADEVSSFSLRGDGRVFVMYRDEALNCEWSNVHWLSARLMTGLSEVDAEFPHDQATVALTVSAALHASLCQGTRLADGYWECAPDDPGYGHHIMLTFYAYGDDAQHVFQRLERTFRNIDRTCRRASQELLGALDAGDVAPPPERDTDRS